MIESYSTPKEAGKGIKKIQKEIKLKFPTQIRYSISTGYITREKEAKLTFFNDQKKRETRVKFLNYTKEGLLRLSSFVEYIC